MSAVTTHVSGCGGGSRFDRVHTVRSLGLTRAAVVWASTPVEGGVPPLAPEGGAAVGGHHRRRRRTSHTGTGPISPYGPSPALRRPTSTDLNQWHRHA
jgi:hypothetical protein